MNAILVGEINAICTPILKISSSPFSCGHSDEEFDHSADSCDDELRNINHLRMEDVEDPQIG